MFESALNWALAIIFIFSLGYFIMSLDRIYKKKSNVLAVAFIVLDFIVYVLFTGDFFDSGFVLPLFNGGGIAFLAGVLLIISLIITNIKSSTEKNGFSKILVGILIAVPLLVLLIPFGYETYLLNNCSYLLTFNYQNGIIQSDYTYCLCRRTLSKNCRDKMSIGSR